MKIKSFTCLFFCLLLSSCFSSLIAQNTTTAVKAVAYIIEVPGHQLSDGNFTPARIIPIEQLAKDDYMPNTIYLKLTEGAKNKFLPENYVQTDPLLMSVKNINVTSIVNMTDDLKLAPQKDIYGITRIYEITYTADKDPYEVCKDLIQNGDVEYAVPVFKRYNLAFTPNDPQFSGQWALSKIKASDAWDITKGDTSIVIAIVDGGTDWQHVDLAANIWNNPREIPNNGIDDDTSGEIDDIHGWDFVGNVTASDIQQGIWKEDNNPRNQSYGHGTQTAGCAAAVTNNSTGIAAIGFNCRILPIKCGSDVSGVSGIYRGYTAILYAAKMGADIISCSWGGPGYNPAEEDIIRQVTAMGSLVVAASGNNGQNTDIFPFYPGAFSDLLNVGSTTSADNFASTTNYGSKVMVFAPGDNVVTSYLNNSYTTSSGTSLACPVVSGLAGLVKSIHPDWNPYQIRQQIRVTCDNILGSAQQSSRYLYWGRINALKAVQYNNSLYPESIIPGVKMYSYSLTGTTTLKNYDPVDMRLYLTNYLAAADSVKVSIQPLSNFISVSKKEFWIYNMNTLDTDTIDFAVELLANTPWFKGNAELLVTYISSGYTDMQKIEIPIELNSNNLFTIRGSINSAIYPQWNGLSSPDMNTCWGIGSSQIYGGLYFKFNIYGFTANRVLNGSSYVTDPLYCIHAFDDQIAIAGTGAGYILRTVNGGLGWTNISVSTITSFVNSILFKDQDTGILIGDPKLGRWGIGLSYDKGQSWTLSNNLPALLSNESGYVESVCQINDNIWFGTSQGRIIYSPNFGKTWNASTVHTGGTITRLAFYDSLHGIASYTESGGTGQSLYLANTSDGGKTWNKKIMNLTQNGLYPLNFYNLPRTKEFMAVFSNGYVYTTADLGTTWVPVLSQQSVLYETVKPYVQQKNVRIWETGDYVNTLDFNYEFDTSFNDVNQIYKSKIQCNIFPVPSTDVIHITTILPKGENTDIQMLDFTGHLIRQIYSGLSCGGYSDFTVSVSDISPGLYFVRIRNTGTITTVPVIISR